MSKPALHDILHILRNPYGWSQDWKLHRCAVCETEYFAPAQPIAREPTEEMIEAGCDAFLARNENRFAIFADDIRAVWYAMCDALKSTGKESPK